MREPGQKSLFHLRSGLWARKGETPLGKSGGCREDEPPPCLGNLDVGWEGPCGARRGMRRGPGLPSWVSGAPRCSGHVALLRLVPSGCAAWASAPVRLVRSWGISSGAGRGGVGFRVRFGGRARRSCGWIRFVGSPGAIKVASVVATHCPFPAEPREHTAALLPPGTLRHPDFRPREH